MLRAYRIIAFLGGNMKKSQTMRPDDGVFSNSPIMGQSANWSDVCAQFIDDHYVAWQIELETRKYNRCNIRKKEMKPLCAVFHILS
ncbi:hypothetical protein EUGRSUZ_F02178 [Eucalyptus grandis]|uniref:Uncharacterized protein n=2 Tax=Eucalyptus grandis TaxID=71139 RepID=A0ACC3KH28_EUCGR|nr:hypothetical protein EUGRSUZ_F02178 [Eucalyptus grandis]